MLIVMIKPECSGLSTYYSYSADVYSLGVTIAEIATGAIVGLLLSAGKIFLSVND